MITWFFGSSSDFSQNMITKLDGDVVQFGRSNVSYHPADIKDWINETKSKFSFAQIWLIREKCIENLTE